MRLSATIGRGGITAIVGSNGAGKSVTLRLIDGLSRPMAARSGSATAADAVAGAFVFQRPGLAPR